MYYTKNSVFVFVNGVPLCVNDANYHERQRNRSVKMNTYYVRPCHNIGTIIGRFVGASNAARWDGLNTPARTYRTRVTPNSRNCRVRGIGNFSHRFIKSTTPLPDTWNGSLATDSMKPAKSDRCFHELDKPSSVEHASSATRYSKTPSYPNAHWFEI